MATASRGAARSSCPSRFTLVKLTTGDLAEHQVVEARAHLQRCDRCQSVLADLNHNVAVFEEQRAVQLAQLKTRLTAPPGQRWRTRRWKWIPTVVTPLVAAAAVVLLVWVPSREVHQSGISFKGTLTAKIVARRGQQQFVVKDGAQLQQNDALRFVLTTSSEGYVSVFSVDARHEVAPFYPQTEPRADPWPLRVEAAGRQELPGSVILDDSLGREHIVVAFSKNKFRRDELHRRVVALLQKEGPTAVDSQRLGMSVIRVEVQKVRDPQ